MHFLFKFARLSPAANAGEAGHASSAIAPHDRELARLSFVAGFASSLVLATCASLILAYFRLGPPEPPRSKRLNADFSAAETVREKDWFQKIQPIPPAQIALAGASASPGWRPTVAQETWLKAILDPKEVDSAPLSLPQPLPVVAKPSSPDSAADVLAVEPAPPREARREPELEPQPQLHPGPETVRPMAGVTAPILGAKPRKARSASNEREKAKLERAEVVALPFLPVETPAPTVARGDKAQRGKTAGERKIPVAVETDTGIATIWRRQSQYFP